MAKKITVYIISILIPLAVGALSAWLTMDGMKAFGDMAQPPLSPPMWLFPIVWTILYVLMGIGSARIFIKRSENKEAADAALYIYALQLLMNFFWSIIFFNMREYLFAFIWLLMLLAAIIIMIRQFYAVDKTAALLQLPYAAWVSFAGYLTLAIWLMQ